MYMQDELRTRAKPSAPMTSQVKLRIWVTSKKEIEFLCVTPTLIRVWIRAL